MRIELGKTEVSMMNPPNDGIVIDGKKTWDISRNYAGLIVLRSSDKTECHPDFLEGMFIQNFCQWINEKLT